MGEGDTHQNVENELGGSTVNGNVVMANIANIGGPGNRPPRGPQWLRALVALVVALAVVVGWALVLLRDHDPAQQGSAARNDPTSTTAATPPEPSPTPTTPSPPPGSTPPDPLPPARTPTTDPAPAPVPVQWQGAITLDDGSANGRPITGYELDPVPPQPALVGDLSLQCLLTCEPDQVAGKAVVPWSGPNPPSREDCRRLLNTKLGQRAVTVRSGSTACFGTAQMRVGYFTTSGTGRDGRLTLAVVVWDLPPGS